MLAAMEKPEGNQHTNSASSSPTTEQSNEPKVKTPREINTSKNQSRRWQKLAGAQTAHQFALESAAPLNEESLVYAFMRDAHGFVIREINPQPIGNLFRRPAIDPFTVTAMGFVSTLERCL